MCFRLFSVLLFKEETDKHISQHTSRAYPLPIPSEAPVTTGMEERNTCRHYKYAVSQASPLILHNTNHFLCGTCADAVLPNVSGLASETNENIGCSPAHWPYFLRLVLEMPQGTRKYARNPPASDHSSLTATFSRHRDPTTAATSLCAKRNYNTSSNLLVLL